MKILWKLQSHFELFFNGIYDAELYTVFKCMKLSRFTFYSKPSNLDNKKKSLLQISKRILKMKKFQCCRLKTWTAKAQWVWSVNYCFSNCLIKKGVSLGKVYNKWKKYIIYTDSKGFLSALEVANMKTQMMKFFEKRTNWNHIWKSSFT